MWGAGFRVRVESVVRGAGSLTQVVKGRLHLVDARDEVRRPETMRRHAGEGGILVGSWGDPGMLAEC